MTVIGDITVQHLIDPELCIRCNTCEETCPIGAISNDYRNYVVDASACRACRDCVAPCPTGAINVWRALAGRPAYTTEEQFAWDALPDDTVSARVDGGGCATSPASAAGRPTGVVENLFTQKSPLEATVVENRRITDGPGDPVHHIVLDVGGDVFPFVEGQSVGVIPPGRDAEDRPFLMRLYSVACPREGEGGRVGHLALTVKRVTVNHEGAAVRGLCSNYLCDLAVGASVQVTGPYGVNFLMPEDDRAPLLMVCTGTGVAPMRAMLQRRRERGGGAPESMALFYGGRTPGDMAYHDELRSHGDRVTVRFAFSRVPGLPKRHVDDEMRDAHDRIAMLLADEQAHVYLCGLRGMEDGVFGALHEVCDRHSLEWPALAARMRAESRLHVETY